MTFAGAPRELPSERETTQGVNVITPPTWHYGLIAEWWAEFNLDGPEIDYFGKFVAQASPPSTPGAEPGGYWCRGSRRDSTWTAATCRPT